MGIAALAGLLVPELTKWFGSWMQERKDRAEHDRKIELMKLAHNQEIDIKDIEGFAKAQMELSGGMEYPATVTTWQRWVILAVNASIHIVRPLLTFCSLGVLVYILASTVGTTRDALLDEVVFTSVAVIRYWFGYREDLRAKKSK
jgi:hypothetical protein